MLLGGGGWGAVAEPAFLRRLALGAGATLVLAAAALGARAVNRSGALAGWLLATATWAFLGWRGFVLLAVFFAVGTATTRLGWGRKAAAGVAQEDGGRRGARHAVANGAVAVVCAALAVVTSHGVLFTLAFATAFATAAADTAGSEVGQLLGRRAWLPTTFRRVSPGTPGAVSLAGTMAALLAASAVALPGAAVGLYSWGGAVVVTGAAMVGVLLESVLGAVLGSDELLDGDVLNFLNTLAGALVAAALSPWVR